MSTACKRFYISTLSTHGSDTATVPAIDLRGAAVMRVVVKKWGNSASVRIPRSIMEAAQLRLDESVDVREEGGRIVIEPIRSHKYELARLLAGITAENMHAGVDPGEPTGKELI